MNEYRLRFPERSLSQDPALPENLLEIVLDQAPAPDHRVNALLLDEILDSPPPDLDNDLADCPLLLQAIEQSQRRVETISEPILTQTS